MAKKKPSPKKPPEPKPSLRLEWVDPADLAANPNNWREHPTTQTESLAGVIAEVGWAGALLYNERTQRLIDGHARKELFAGKGPVPVLVGDWSEEQEKLILSTLDPLSAMAEANKDKLDALLREVQTGNSEVGRMLTELAESEGIIPATALPEPGAGGDEFDAAAAMEGECRVKPGDLWLIDGGKHRLICGDSTDAATVERLMGGEKAALVYTDPPYGVDYDGGTTVREKLAGDGSTELYAPCCLMARDYSDEKAALYLWHAGVKGIAAAAAAAAAGWEIRCELIWNKNLAQFGALSAQYKQKHEPAYYCFKRGKVPRWYGPTNEVTVWDCNRAMVNEFHPTQKPVEIAARAINNSSETGQLVLDLFLGSGATIIAGHRLNRRVFGCELEPKYCEVILRRCEAEGLSVTQEVDK